MIGLVICLFVVAAVSCGIVNHLTKFESSNISQEDVDEIREAQEKDPRL